MQTNDFLVREGFVAKGACERLVGLYTAVPHLYERGFEHDFWNGRTLDVKVIRTVNGFAADLLERIVADAIVWIRHFYVCGPLYPDTLNLVGWPAPHPGMPLHADNAYASGEPHALAHRAYGAMIYLTDDYEGGELFVERPLSSLTTDRQTAIAVGDLRTTHRFPAGTLVSLPAGLSHQHGVSPVRAGLRLALTFFLTHDAARSVL